MHPGKYCISEGRSGAATGLLVLLAVASLLLLISAERGIGARPAPQGKETSTGSRLEGWKQELRVFEGRWTSLLTSQQSADKFKWMALENDFQASAKKYDQHLEEHMRRANPDKAAAAGNPVGLAVCPARDDVPGYRCYVFKGPSGVCRYLCAPFKK